MFDNQEFFSALIVGMCIVLVVVLGILLRTEPANTLVLHHDNKMTPDRLKLEIETELWMYKYYTIVTFGEQASIIGHTKKPDASNYYRAWVDYERLAYDVCSRAGWL